MASLCLAVGIITKNSKNEIIEVYYPEPILHPIQNLLNDVMEQNSTKEQYFLIKKNHYDKFADIFKNFPTTVNILKHAKNSSRELIIINLDKDLPPSSIPESFIKLQMISHRLVKPHDLNLKGIFSILKNIAWTNQGAIDLEDLDERQIISRLNGEVIQIYSVDKFPKMVDYTVPSQIRIGDCSRVRLGAYLGKGTTIMHEGFVNFNAGTLGESMVEGRISAGVVVGNGSDIGGGASIMGTLSGGGSVTVSIGEKSLLGANSGLGFPLGNNCIIEAGLYVTPGSKVTVLDESGEVLKTTKALDLANIDNLLFRRNSLNGSIECLTNSKTLSLNAELHKN